MISAIVGHKEILKELFFKTNREAWIQANFRIEYESVRNKLKLGPFMGLLYQKKELNDQNPFLSNLNQMTFNLIPKFTKEVIHRLPIHSQSIKWVLNEIPGIRELSDHEVETLASGINEFIVNFRLSESHLVSELFTPPHGFDLQYFPEESKLRLIESFQDFINHFPLERKRRMVHALLKLSPNASLGRIVAATGIYSGPIFIKLLQLLQNYSSPEMQSELRIFLDQLPPHLNEKEIKDMIEQEIPEKILKKIIYFNYSPLSVASLGQVHEMILETSSGKIVKAIVKFLAPKFEQMVEADLSNLENAMKNFKFGRKLVSSMKNIMNEELDLMREAKFTQLGAKLYRDPKKGIDVVDILEGEDFPLTKNIEAQAFALGIPLTKINEQAWIKEGISESQYYIYLSRALISYMKKWFKNVIFENQHVAHADSHKGNIFFDVNHKNSNFIKPYRLTIIDFGSMCQMSKEEAEAVIMIGQGLFLSQTSDILYGFKRLSLIANEGKIDSGELEKLKKLEEFINLVKKDYISMHHLFTKIATEALRLQIDFPTSFLQFNRGRIFIEDLIDESLKKLKNMDDIEAQLEYKNLQDSFEIYMSSALNLILKNIRNKVTSFGNSSSVVSVSSMTIGSIRKCVTVLNQCIHKGVIKASSEEVYPFVKNVCDLSTAVIKDFSND